VMGPKYLLAFLFLLQCFPFPVAGWEGIGGGRSGGVALVLLIISFVVSHD